MSTPSSSYWKPKSTEEKLLSEMVLETLAFRGVLGWSVIFSRESNRLGYCNYTDKTICISRKVVLSSWVEAVDTAMHEAAHAIAPYGAKHGPIWQAIAKDLGAKPQAKADYVNSHQTGETKTLKTNYGPVKITVGQIYEVGSSIGKLRILEVQRKSFVGESALGSRHSLSIDLLHPHYGDSSKIPRKSVIVKDGRGRSVEIVLGKSVYLKGKDAYVAVEARRRNVLTVGPTGDKLLVPAEYFRK